VLDSLYRPGLAVNVRRAGNDMGTNFGPEYSPAANPSIMRKWRSLPGIAFEVTAGNFESPVLSAPSWQLLLPPVAVFPWGTGNRLAFRRPIQ
jgi:hypothetical protein